MDISELVSAFATGTYSVTRRQANGATRGVMNPTTDSIISIVASVQPASGQDLLRLPEGRRTNQTRTIFTTTQLLVGDSGTAFEADLIDIDGVEWEVQHCAVWVESLSGGIVYQAVAQQSSGTGDQP